MRAAPLLKFKDEAAYLDPEGIDIIKGLSGTVCPIIFIGDGRSGKSYLASRLLGQEGAFTSSDSSDPVTEGVDVLAVPTARLLEECGEPGAGAVEDEHVLVLDCEGGNNAMAAIRTLVNVFGIVVGTEVVFVANGMATEQALQNLGASLAARSLVHMDGASQVLQQHLVFVVNKNTLRYEDSALEKILDKKYSDPGRREVRDSVRQAFPQRYFYAVPLAGMPNFEDSLQALRVRILQSRQPLMLDGSKVGGGQLVHLLQHLVDAISKTNEVNFPSMKRCVLFDGFLEPLVKRLGDEAEAALPRPEEYEPEIEAKDPQEPVLERFDKATGHLAHETALHAEARASLGQRLSSLWAEVLHVNASLGEQILEVKQEERQVFESDRKVLLGRRGLLKKVLVTQKSMKIESRAVVHRKRGGEPECSEWAPTSRVVDRLEESAFEHLPQLPVIRGYLEKWSPSVFRSLLKPVNGDKQLRICIVKDGHFLWWEPKAIKNGQTVEAKGCINFLVHRAEVVADDDNPTVFCIRPIGPEGWAQASSFTGGGQRAFYFDISPDSVSRDNWVSAIDEHIKFGNLAREQLGEEKVLRMVGVYRPTFEEVECG